MLTRDSFGIGVASCVLVAGLASGHPTLERLKLNGEGDAGAAAAMMQFPSENVTLLSQLPLSSFPGQADANDCWGYTSPSGREYAILGLRAATAFIEITDPFNPQIIETIPGASSLWRDIKTMGSHAYSVNESGNGIQVMDLGAIDAGVVTLVNEVTTGGTTATHNIVINEDTGFLYRTGGGSSQVGFRVYATGKADALGNPTPGSPSSPVLVRTFNDVYVHDAQVVTWDRPGPYQGREIAFACSGTGNGSGNTALRIYDVTDKSSFVLIKEIPYPSRAYSHQGWLSEDRTLFYLNDELDEGQTVSTTTMRIFDVADLDNASFLTLDTNGVASIDHNLYVRDGLLYAANYRSGLRVFDLSTPDDPDEVAFIDTFPSNDSIGFDGAWSSYPFFESGNVIISDINSGLFVVRVDLPSATITPSDAPAFLAPEGGTELRADITGRFGSSVSGAMLKVRDESGSVASFDGQDLGGGSYSFVTGPLECGSTASYWFEAQTSAGETVLQPAGAPAEVFELPVASEEMVAFANSAETDPGFVVSGPAVEGRWDRGVPLNNGRGDPDADYDGSGQAWLTQNDPLDVNSDVDNGETVLTSPAIDASEGGTLSWAYWLNDVPNGELGPEDFLRVDIATNSAGTDWQTVRTYQDTQFGWREDSMLVGDGQAVAQSPTLRVRFVAADNSPGGVVEAGIDAIGFGSFVCDECSNPADVNQDGQVSPTDFGAWLTAFNAGDSLADQNFDGQVTPTDFGAWLTNFNIGCP